MPRIEIKIIIFIFLFFSLFSLSAKESHIFSIEEPAEFCKPKIALVLSGGGARGISQIGAIKELEKNKIHFDYIIGTSIGSINGGMLAMGYTPNELDSIVKSIDWTELFSLKNEQERSELFLDQKLVRDRSLLTLKFDNFRFLVPEAISVGTKLFFFIQQIVWNSAFNFQTDFDSLKYPFRAVATDLAAGRTVSISQGNLALSIRSSSTVPLRYTPVWLDSMVLVDGGLMANLPTKQAMEFNPDLVIAISTVSPLLNIEELSKPWNVADQAVSIQMEKFSEQAREIADILIEPDLKVKSNLDFTDLDSLIMLGEEAAKSSIEKANELIYSKKKERCLKVLEKLESYFNGFPTIILNGFAKEDSLTVISNSDSFEKLLLGIFSLENLSFYSSISFQKNEISELEITCNKYNIIKGIEIFDNNLSLNHLIEAGLKKLFLNKPFNVKTEKEIKIWILKELRHSGFTFASAQSIQYNDEDGKLKIYLDYGKVNEISIISNKATKDFLVLRDLKFSHGDFLDLQKISTSWNNLINSGLFESIEFNVNKAKKADGVDVSILVKEPANQTLSIGGRVDNERNSQIGFDFTQNNLLNVGAKLNARISGGSRNRYGDISIIQPRILSTMITFSLTSYYDYKEHYIYSFKPNSPRNRFARVQDGACAYERYGFRASCGSQIERKGNLLVGLRLEKQRRYDPNSIEKKPDFYSVNTIKIGTSFDTEDNLDFPTKGSIINLSLETNLFGTGNNSSFSKAEFFSQNVFSSKRYAFVPSLLVGFADKSLPAPESFIFGGQDNFFGYREGDETGRQIFVSSFDFRVLLPFSIFFDTYFSFRYDLGSIWREFEEIKFSSLKHGIGATIAVDSPIGPAKLSAGKAFNFLKSPATLAWGETVLYFSIGIKL